MPRGRKPRHYVLYCRACGLPISFNVATNINGYVHEAPLNDVLVASVLCEVRASHAPIPATISDALVGVAQTMLITRLHERRFVQFLMVAQIRQRDIAIGRQLLHNES